MTLTQAAILTRKGVIAFFIFIFLIITGMIGYNIWHQYYLAHLPPVEEKPDLKFGSLPKIIFPPTKVSSSNYSYSLDTTTGGLPQMPKIIKVYFIPKANISLLSSEKATDLASKLGFPNEPEILSPSQYRFTDNNKGELLMDITTGNFKFERPEASSAAERQDIGTVTKNQLVQELKEYLGSKNLLATDLQSGQGNTTFDGPSISQSNHFIVSLWPADIDKLSVINGNSSQGLVKAILTKAARESEGGELNKFISLEYTYWPVDKTTYSTYPLKTTDQAFAELRAGQGFVSLEPTSAQVSISSVRLGYFEQTEYTPYLQPIYIFEGEHFQALVPATGEVTPPAQSSPSPSTGPSVTITK